MLDFIQNFPLFCIIMTLFSGVLCSVLSARAARNCCLMVVSADGVLNAAVLVYTIRMGDSFTYMMGHFPAPWGNEIRVGVLEAMLAMVFSIVMLLSLLGGMKHIFEDVESTKVNLYFLMMNLLFVSMLCLIYTNDLFTGYVFVEINTIAACAIVMARKGNQTLVATMRYLCLSLLGSGMFLMGICILYDITGHLLMVSLHGAIEQLASSGQYAQPLEVVIVLFCVGLATKSALFPFHSWLPDAHGSSTSASSAILSGLVLKGYIILLIKIVYRVLGTDVFNSSKAINVLFFFGCCAMIVGSLHAMTEKDLKRMIAYSSVAQIGYIYMAIGLGSTTGMIAAVFQILAHAFTKPMLFDAAGGFMEVSGGSRKFSRLRGAGRRNGLAGIAFVVGALSMIGIPMFAGFITKYYLAAAAIQSGTKKLIIGLMVLAVSTLLNAMYYVPAIMVLFSRAGGNSQEGDKFTLICDKKNVSFVIAMAVFIAANLYLGCCSGTVIRLIQSGLNMLA